MFANVLIVCHANVCRSPAAEMLFKARQRAASRPSSAPIAFHSAGLRAVNGHAHGPGDAAPARRAGRRLRHPLFAAP